MPLSAGLGAFSAPAPGDDPDEPETVLDHDLRARSGGVARLGRAADEESVDDTKTVVSHDLLRQMDLDEETDDPVTARSPDHPSLAGGGGLGGAGFQALDRADDPETVQLSRLPLSFIGAESVGDPATQLDSAAEATRWREDAGYGRIDELPPGPLPSAAHDAPSPTLARGERVAPEETEEDEPLFDLRTAVLVPVLIGAVFGVLSIVLVAAFLAGWWAM
ncbi:MAG: hypothetical protein R3F59_31900 [Myxococcota bacterium]